MLHRNEGREQWVALESNEQRKYNIRSSVNTSQVRRKGNWDKVHWTEYLKANPGR